MVLNSVVSALPQGERGDISRYTLTPVLTAKIDLKLFIHMLYDPPSIPRKLKSIYSFPPHMFVPPPKEHISNCNRQIPVCERGLCSGKYLGSF